MTATNMTADDTTTGQDGGQENDPEGAASPGDAQARTGFDWWQEIKSIFVLIAAVLAFHSFIAKPFYIPSESMMPVLLTGDRLVVSKYPYGWSYASLSFHPLPFTKGRILGRMPERGDIVIAIPPNRNEDYIKRVIGLPGDILEVRDGIVVLNGIAVPQVWIPPLRIPVDANAPCPPDQFPGALVEDKAGNRWCELPVKQETLPNGKTYRIIDVGSRALDWYGPVRIPANHVFLMGDNRDNSADSRATLAEKGLGGPVPWESIGGRAEFVTFSLDGTATINPFSWITALRGGRAGSSLRPDMATTETPR
ncbi:signal peptidase I [Sphingobium algorifonticola]|uniref:Signal peptidase I n=1 Tax=Sphingobium algorifonticola TaxID=2008318 RepID=A0A437J5W9_9SPHN|nr:signal peptidase I [Sphingobium algorifonticola]RVT40317.1 signal peptidase I [Sphingobium algorifonticola]